VSRRTVSAPGAPEAVGPYSHATVAAELLHCSGQVPLDPASGRLVEGDAGAQTRRCLENLAVICEAAGTALDRAVRCTIYLADLPRDYAMVNAAYGEFFGDDPPARVTVGVSALPGGATVEIDATVALDG
jgi:2-iminobutanoate/2-iminopropanoate deaminase